MPHENLRIARSRAVPDGFFEKLQDWLVKSPLEDGAVRAGLKRWVRGYQLRPAAVEQQVETASVEKREF